MNEPVPVRSRLAPRQWSVVALCVPLMFILMAPLAVALGARDEWVSTVPFFVIGVSVAFGVVATFQDPAGRGVVVDRARAPLFWAGLALIVLLPAVKVVL